jgi:hypothetical protein
VDITAGLNILAGDGSGVAPAAGARVGVLPRVDIGIIEDALSTNADIKLHALTQEMVSFDAAVSVGGGVSVLAAYRYFNVIFSIPAGAWTPYTAYRKTSVSEDRTESDDQDAEGIESAVYTLITGAVDDLEQVFVGTEYRLSGRTSYIIEAMFLTAEGTEDLFSVNTGLSFRF